MASQSMPVSQSHNMSSAQASQQIHDSSSPTGTNAAMKSVDSIQVPDAPPSYIKPASDMTLKTGGSTVAHQQYPTNTQPKPTAPPHAQIPNYVIDLKDLGEEPDWVDCPHCKSRERTTVSHPDSSATTLAGLFCCLFCGVITVCIPCLCHWFAETDHHCSKCKKLVAHKPHDGQMEPRLPVPPQQARYKASQYHQMGEEERRRIAGDDHGEVIVEKGVGQDSSH